MAQRLYEAGYITYMRTDGVQIGKDSVVAIRESINNIFGGNFLPLNPIEYSNNVVNAQEAHEAIRPTDPKKSPESIENNIGPRKIIE